MRLDRLDKALGPYERVLRAQERFRKMLGVREVERPTYEKYITGTIERFDRRRNAFMVIHPDNPYLEDFREKFIKRTGHGSFLTTLPYSELEVEDRIGQSLQLASYRLCVEHHPKPLDITPPEGRVEVTDRAWMSRLIKKVGLLFGADMVRIARLDQRWVYQGLDIPHKYVVVCAVTHKPSLNNLAPSHFSVFSVGDTYSRLKLITTQLADFIRGLGHDAAYRETLGVVNPELNMVPIAMDAGFGEFARNGRVLSPESGINLRFKPVTTDLPLEPDKPISFNVHEFCMACEHCATYCPANAIPFGPPTDDPPTIHNNAGARKWYIRADRCLTFWAVNKKKWTSCGGRCIAVCPWNKPRNALHNTVRWAAIHSPEMVKKMLVWGDRVVYRRRKSIRR